MYEKFRDGFAERAKAVKVGDGLDDGVQMGPMANPRRPDAMERLIGGAVKAKGATLHTGGERLGNQGYFYAPTRALRDAARRRHHERGAVRPGRAHQSLSQGRRHDRGGQSPALRSRGLCLDRRRQAASAASPRDVETGMLGINSTMIGGADAPFGGVKWSGPRPGGRARGPDGLHGAQSRTG